MILPRVALSLAVLFFTLACCGPQRVTALTDAELSPSGVVTLDEVSFSRIVGRGSLRVVVQFALNPWERHVDTASRHLMHPDVLFAHTTDRALLQRFAPELLSAGTDEAMHSSVVCFFGAGVQSEAGAERLAVYETASLLEEVSARLVPELPAVRALWEQLASASGAELARQHEALSTRAEHLAASTDVLARNYGAVLATMLKRVQQHGVEFVDHEIKRVKVRKRRGVLAPAVFECGCLFGSPLIPASRTRHHTGPSSVTLLFVGFAGEHASGVRQQVG
jgi:hypothetical protein